MFVTVKRVFQAPWLQSVALRSFASLPVPQQTRPQIWILPRIPVSNSPHVPNLLPPPQQQLPQHNNHTDRRNLQISASPFAYGDPWTNLILQVMNRNNRKAKRANHGKRPCSRVGRRARARRFGNPKRN